MSWEHSDYIVACLDCGHQATIRFSSDDWNRFEAEATGFGIVRAYAFKPHSSILRCEKCKCERTSISKAKEPN